MRFLVLLRFVVLRPRLAIAFLNCNRLSYSLRMAICDDLSAERDLNCVDVFASLSPVFKVRSDRLCLKTLSHSHRASARWKVGLTC